MRYLSEQPIRRSYIYDFKNKEKSVEKYVDYFLARTNTMFKYNNLPDTIPPNFLEMFLQRNGVVGIAKVNDNMYAFTGGIGGKPNVYYFPENFIVANPALNYSAELKIDEECVLVRNDSSYEGLLSLCCKYATLLVENDITMLTANINKRIPVIAATHSDNTKQGLDMFITKVTKGDLSIGVSDDFAESLRTMPYSAQDTTRITDFIEYHNYIKASFFNEIGVRMSHNMKRESLTEKEITSGDDFVQTLVLDMLTCRQRDFEKVNSLFGTNISVDFDHTWKSFMDEKENSIESVELENDLIESEIDVNENSEENNDEEVEVEDE